MTSRINMLNILAEREKCRQVYMSTNDALTIEVVAEYARCLDEVLAENAKVKPASIERIMAVPEDIEAAIQAWDGLRSASDALVDAAWLAIGASIEAHVAEKVADTLRLERGGCQHCPAEKGGPHKMDCQRTGAGLTRIPVEFKP